MYHGRFRYRFVTKFEANPLLGSIVTGCQVSPQVQPSAKFELKHKLCDSRKCVEIVSWNMSAILFRPHCGKHNVNKPHGKPSRLESCLSNGMVLHVLHCLHPTNFSGTGEAPSGSEKRGENAIITLIRHVDVIMTSSLRPMSARWCQQL